MVAGTKDEPWQLTTAPGSSIFSMFIEGDEFICQVGSTTLRYHSRAIDDLDSWLIQRAD